MATSIIPALIDALIAEARTALPDRLVLDGYGVTDSAKEDLLMVGVDDPDSTDSASSADSSQRAATMGTGRSRDEEGDISCVSLSWSGDVDQKKVRDRAFATCAAVADLCRSNPSLGVSGYQMVVTSYGTNQTLQQNQDGDGAEAAVFFSIHFKARL